MSDQKIEDVIKDCLRVYFLEHGWQDEVKAEDPEEASAKMVKKMKSKFKIAGAKSFAGLVKDMRTYQRRFFNGEKSVLDKSKQAEKKVDKALEVIMKSYGQ